MKFLKAIVLVLCPFVLSAQLSTSGALTPVQLVQNILVGQGVTVSNIQFLGANGAIGSFNASNTSLDIENGIILTTGTIANNNAGPHGPNDQENAGMDNGSGGYGLLTNIVGTQTYNASILEFDFVPQSDTVRFDYIFGSDEYPEYVGTQFNDVFAFFISGPGINGQKNMAIIPGTNAAVAINNVNNGKNNNGPCNNCQHYVNNGTGNNSPYNGSSYYVQYDGFTTPLQAVSPVQCGETYHLIIAVADVGDPYYDSGIFLAANSLSSEQPVGVSYTISDNIFGDGQTLAQGCANATVTVTRSGNNINQPLTIPINVTGTAQNGIDYSGIPSEVTFNAGQTQASFTVDALINESLDGTVSINIEFEIFDPCDNEEFESIKLFIQRVEDLDLSLTANEVLCEGQEVEIFANVSGGAGGYNYAWSTGENTSTITVQPTETETYSVEVSDECSGMVLQEEITLEVPVFEDLTISTSDDIVEQCPYVDFDIEAQADGGAGNFSYVWTDSGTGEQIGSNGTISVSPSSTTTYRVLATDFCGDTISDQVMITILSPPLVLEITANQEICPSESTVLSVQASGGFGDYFYLWTHNGDTTNSVIVAPTTSTNYEVIVSDDCQTFERTAETFVKVISPDADFELITEPVFINLPLTFQNLTVNGDNYHWSFGDGNVSTQIHPNNTYTDPGEYEITLIAEDEKGCIDSISKIINIKDENYLYIPNAFIPEGSEDFATHNPTFKVSAINIVEFNIIIFNRWGEVIYESNNVDFEWNGRINGIGPMLRDGVYPWKIRYKSINDISEVEIDGFVTIIR